MAPFILDPFVWHLPAKGTVNAHTELPTASAATLVVLLGQCTLVQPYMVALCKSLLNSPSAWLYYSTLYR